MKITQVLVEATQASVAFAFGRFNPAHRGHIEVWRAVEEAGKNWFIGTNPTTIGPNDPLTFEQKSAWMEEIYPPITGHIVPQTTVLSLAAYIFKKLRNNESATIAYVTDDTDWAWSGKLLNQYNGVEGAHGYYKFAQITHVPSPRVSSATALRDAARADDKVAFYQASGTDPKLKVAGKTYFDTVKEACEKYPLPVKRAKKVAEAPDANFVGFMNKAMNTRQDKKPLAYDPKTVMSMDTMPGFKKAFKFGMDVIKKMDPDTKQEFANAPDDTLFSYMMNIAEKKGYVPEHFMYEDLDEVTGEFEEIFHDPDMEGWTWTDLLRDMIGMEPRAYNKANVQAHKKEFSHAQQMAAKGPGPIDPNKLKAVTRSDTKQTEIWYPINPNYEAGGWVVVATGFQNKEQAEQKLAQMKQDPSVNKQIQAALNKKKNESVNQGVAEGSGGNWYIRVNGKILNDTKFKPVIFSSKDEARSHAMKLADKKRIPLSQMKLTKSWMDAPEQGVTEDEQKTVAKTWDQMTPQEKISGVKGRTVWNEKTHKYYTVFDVPVKQTTDEGWFKNTAAGLALGAAAMGGAQAGTTVDDPSWHSGKYPSHIKSDHTIQKQTGSSSTHQKRISDVTGPNAAGEYKVTVTQNGKIASQFVTKTPPPDWMMKEQDLDEASLSTMRDYFAGDEQARDPYEITKQRLHFSKDKNAKVTTQKRFKSQAEYEDWLIQNHLKHITPIKEDEEAGEVKKTGQLIPFPAGTTKVHVSDVYDWYKLGMVISDLDDADPKMFGQGAPESIIAFGSEEEESKLLPLLKRLGLRVDDIDPEGVDVDEAYHAGSLYEMLRKNSNK